MKAIKFKILAPPAILKEDVECIRIAEYSGEEGLAINVSLNGTPGLVFQHNEGRSVIKNIVTRSGRQTGEAPTLFIYGQNTERSIMHQLAGPFTMTQVIFKPHALNSLLGINASELTNSSVKPGQFSAEDLNSQLMEAASEQKRITLLTNFLISQQKRRKTRDKLVQESLGLIQSNIRSASVKYLLDQFSISERQFEKRFTQSVGIAPQFYIRIKRFNEAISLIKTGQFERLTDVAYVLNYYDQSHFIRDIKEFSGITPKSLAQALNDYHHGPAGYSYL
jgi:AraC-like DNA-binding protein